MHSLTRGKWDKGARHIRAFDQDQIVKQFAQRQLADLRRISEYGPRLYQFAEGLGHLLKQYLLASKQEPDERLRIEIEGTAEMSAQAQHMHDALLRHSVLIAGGSGKDRQGRPTRKLFFRRLFAPCFPFSPTRGDCVPLKVEEYERWLLDPGKIWRKPDSLEEGGLFTGED